MSNVINVLEQENLLDHCQIQFTESGKINVCILPETMVKKELDRIHDILLAHEYVLTLVRDTNANPLILKYITLPKPVEI
jgi:hypothetical protein